jgi:transketolase
MEKITMRDAFFNRLYELAKKDKKIIIINADMGAPALDKFRRNLSGQFINAGIAEANMVNVAAGLALGGKNVFIYAIMPFVTSRCYEMIKVNLSLMNIAVTAVGVGAGFSYEESGPTHHSTEDIAIMRALPNMTILSPADSVMAAHCADISSKLSGPGYVRLDRLVLPQIYNQNEDFSAGLTNLKKGKDLYIIATGNMVHRAMEVSRQLANFKIDAGVIDLYRIKPVNLKLLLKNIQSVEALVTLEEHLIAGGMGSAVVELLTDNNVAMPVKRIGVQDKYYYAYGGRANIQALCGLDEASVTKKIQSWFKGIKKIVYENKS